MSASPWSSGCKLVLFTVWHISHHLHPGFGFGFSVCIVQAGLRLHMLQRMALMLRVRHGLSSPASYWFIQISKTFHILYVFFSSSLYVTKYRREMAMCKTGWSKDENALRIIPLQDYIKHNTQINQSWSEQPCTLVRTQLAYVREPSANKWNGTSHACCSEVLPSKKAIFAGPQQLSRFLSCVYSYSRTHRTRLSPHFILFHSPASASGHFLLHPTKACSFSALLALLWMAYREERAFYFPVLGFFPNFSWVSLPSWEILKPHWHVSVGGGTCL